MTIRVGERIPHATLTRIRDGVDVVTSEELFDDRKVVLFAVPGAFTPTCSEQHLPGFIQHMAQFRERGVEVACMAVNDAFVMDAWARAQDVPDDLVMLADGNADLTRALGLELDGSGFGMGLRSQRFALYAEDGTVKILQVEAPGEFRVSSAEAMLQALDAR
ncbi:peroxiredoxin [Oleiagrimonas soli]|uniref:Glutathione-dependent peroxiredoxin n=1 Tax=Oleiagrimonas soli TaxID=1543381 RepID=A0A099CYS6_9GAMM|nr:peroxiredoxin [Oleiagrimonas soli]KGI78175.1 peroxiredoxin [Oleiagrimonas soli]MBB6183370.1 peroxiredoxin [Oleiagrimonas soli]